MKNLRNVINYVIEKELEAVVLLNEVVNGEREDISERYANDIILVIHSVLEDVIGAVALKSTPIELYEHIDSKYQTTHNTRGIDLFYEDFLEILYDYKIEYECYLEISYAINYCENKIAFHYNDTDNWLSNAYKIILDVLEEYKETSTLDEIASELLYEITNERDRLSNNYIKAVEDFISNLETFKIEEKSYEYWESTGRNDSKD